MLVGVHLRAESAHAGAPAAGVALPCPRGAQPLCSAPQNAPVLGRSPPAAAAPPLPAQAGRPPWQSPPCSSAWGRWRWRRPASCTRGPGACSGRTLQAGRGGAPWRARSPAAAPAAGRRTAARAPSLQPCPSNQRRRQATHRERKTAGRAGEGELSTWPAPCQASAPPAPPAHLHQGGLAPQNDVKVFGACGQGGWGRGGGGARRCWAVRADAAGLQPSPLLAHSLRSCTPSRVTVGSSSAATQAASSSTDSASTQRRAISSDAASGRCPGPSWACRGWVIGAAREPTSGWRGDSAPAVPPVARRPA